MALNVVVTQSKPVVTQAPGPYEARVVTDRGPKGDTGNTGVTGPAAVLAGARKWKTTTQTITPGATVGLTVEATDYNNSDFDLSFANQIRVVTSGLYLVTAEADFRGGAAGERTLLLRLTTPNVSTVTVRESGAVGTNVRASLAAVLNLTAGQRVGLAVYGTGGSNFVINDVNNTQSKDTGFTVVRLG